MKPYRGFSRTVFLSLLGGVLGALLFGVSPAHAQATVSTFSVAVKAQLLPQDTGLKESVQIKGNCAVSTKVSTDPVLGPSVVVGIDCTSLSAIGSDTGAAYQNLGIANLTRPFTATDVLTLTFPIYRDPNLVPDALFNGGVLALTLNLTYNTTTLALTGATGSLTGIKTYIK